MYLKTRTSMFFSSEKIIKRRGVNNIKLKESEKCK
jgi:hypothetical protein